MIKPKNAANTFKNKQQHN